MKTPKTAAEQWVLNNLELIDLPGMGKCELARIAFTSGEAAGLRQAQEIMDRFGFGETLAADATRMAEEQQKQHWAAQQDQDEQFINNEV